MERMSELMGAAERSYSKLVYAETPSGRVAQWATLQAAIDVLFHDGFALRIDPAPDGALTSAGARRRIRAEQARWNAATTRQHMTELGAKGLAARNARMTPEERSAHARRAAAARWCRLSQEQRSAATAPARAAKGGKR